MKIASLCSPRDGLHYAPWHHCPSVRQSHSIDDAVNDVVMVEVDGQKWKVIIYNIHSRYLYIHFVPGVRATTSCSFGVPPACIYPAVLGSQSTEYRKDNQPWLAFPWVNLLENLKMWCWSPSSGDETSTTAMDVMPFWPKLLHLVADRRQKARRVHGISFYHFLSWKTCWKILSTSLIGLESHPCSCGGIDGSQMKHGWIIFYNRAISAIVLLIRISI